MDFTDEQWEVLEPLIPDPLKEKIDEADPGEILATSSTASSGYCVRVRHGRTFRSATLHIRAAVVAFRGGSRKGFWAAYSKLWQKISKSEGG
jgi:hypothetical protein